MYNLGLTPNFVPFEEGKYSASLVQAPGIILSPVLILECAIGKTIKYCSEKDISKRS